jgi:hypothetical protein
MGSSVYLSNWALKLPAIIKFASVFGKLEDMNLHLYSGGKILRKKETMLERGNLVVNVHSKSRDISLGNMNTL